MFISNEDLINNLWKGLLMCSAVVSMTIYKPKLTVDDQIKQLLKNGVKFDRMSEQDAVEYLSTNNNYFKVTAYRKTFCKYQNGPKVGQYIDLDFAQLKDLSIIDMRLRYVLLHIALDVEHFAKVRLIKYIEDSSDDGYKIVSSYINSLGQAQRLQYDCEIDRNRNNSYCGAIIQKYDGQYPVWAFVEVIPLGRFIAFYGFCADYYNDTVLKDEYFLMLASKELRNAAAHSNCIINDLSPQTTTHSTNNQVSQALSRIAGISKTSRTRKMSNARIQQIVTLLYTHKKMVTSEGIHNHQCNRLYEIIERMFSHIDFYSTNLTITTTFGFLKLVVDSWFAKSV